jgi:hypothetical protein
MSTAVFSTSAASGRPFVFDEDVDPCKLMWGEPPSAVRSSEARLSEVLQSEIKNRKSEISLTSASRLAIRPSPEMVTSGVAALDALTGGLPRGCLTEICGPASSGRTTVLLAALAAATHRGEFCAVVDASDALDPQSAADAGVELTRLLWVRCGNLEQVLRATDLLLESGGFGLIVLDLGDLPPLAARRIPLTTWFRFRRAVEHTPTILLAIAQQPIAGNCASLLLQLQAAKRQKSTAHGASRGLNVPDDEAPEERQKTGFGDPNFALPVHARLLPGLEIHAELIRSRLERKPVRSVSFATKTAWAG